VKNTQVCYRGVYEVRGGNCDLQNEKFIEVKCSLVGWKATGSEMGLEA
jgi:hypothetical protein